MKLVEFFMKTYITLNANLSMVTIDISDFLIQINSSVDVVWCIDEAKTVTIRTT